VAGTVMAEDALHVVFSVTDWGCQAQPLTHRFCRPSIHSLPVRVCRRVPAFVLTMWPSNICSPAPMRTSPVSGNRSTASPGATTCKQGYVKL
jgi:hypothetical protein